MWFPQNPKVLVVDDTPSEIDPLLKLFSQNGIPYVYFDGKEDSLPDKPFSSIRLVILDIDLEGRTTGLDDKSKASVLANYISQLITIKDSLYAILFWTKRKEVIDNVIKYLSQENGEPVVWKDMEKPAKADLNLEYVREKFFSNLQDDVFEYLIKWEEGISKDASSFTNMISNIAKKESVKASCNWTESMKSILTKFACTYTGEKSITDKSNAISYATNILNIGLSESFSSNIELEKTITLPQNSSLSFETLADLNNILFFEDVLDPKKIENGKVFHSEDLELLELLKTDKTIKKFLQYGEVSLISIILTPSCDIAHHKNLRKLNAEDSNIIDFEVHRILYGVQIDIVNDKYEDSGFLTLLKSKGPENVFFIQPFKNPKNGGKSIIIFHFDTVTYKRIKQNEYAFDFMLKENLTYDLQTKLANHVNRLGNNMLVL